MEEENTMSLKDALRIIMDKIGNIRVPVREKEISSALDEVAEDLYQCIVAIENHQEPEKPEPEVNEDV